ncbi:MAG: OsmC family protein [Planctomycetota bacterium]
MDLITLTRKEGLAFEMAVRGHKVSFDMAVEEGGADDGMKPVELLAGSLAACISIMTQKYCDTQGYSDGDVGASMTIELASDPKRVAGIVIDLELPGDFPEEKHRAVHRIAELCPVHGTLKNMPKIDLEIS